MVRTGYYFAVGPALVAVLLGWFGLWGFATISFLLAGFVLFFFRDPERTIPTTPGAIVSPADGRVISVDQTDLLGSSHTRISIFLSVFDVHVNRAPIEGTVDDIQYRAGRFHIASHDQASHENEQNEVTMAGEGTRVVFRQIAGVLARRIEFWKKPGDQLERGERLGMIRFGSRVEVFFPPHYRARVRPNDHVQGGSSVLAIRE
jgi:phosphatidylserine decarboxylase